MRVSRTIIALVACVALAAATRAAAPLTPEQALRKAAVEGKYRMLLQQIHVPNDAENYSEFRDWGPWTGTSYATFENLPPGHWVYVQPFWYIWRDLSAERREPRAWGPEQATGGPDTAEAGDIPTAWASRTADEDDEWLMLEYEGLVIPRSVSIHETYNPGAVTRVSLFTLEGEEKTVWTGSDPTSRDAPRGETVLPLDVNFKTNRVKIYLKSRDVPGWNEIDAVGLTDAGGKTQWAASAHASSTYAEPETADALSPEERIQRLEAEVRRLREIIERLRAALQGIGG